MQQPEFLTSKQVAMRIGVAEITVKSWRRRQTGPPWLRLGDSEKSRVLYPAAELDKWLSDRIVYPGADCER